MQMGTAKRYAKGRNIVNSACQTRRRKQHHIPSPAPAQSRPEARRGVMGLEGMKASAHDDAGVEGFASLPFASPGALC